MNSFPGLLHTSIGKKNMIKHYQSWTGIAKAQISPLLKHCGIILPTNESKGSQHPKKSFQISFKKPGELYLKTTCLTEFRLKQD